MTRNTFFSFHYSHVWRVNQIRNLPQIIPKSAAGFTDSSLWEEAKKKGESTIKKMIDKALQNTTVTVICITYGCANRKYINYEIEQSLKRGNGLVGLQIHHLKDQWGKSSSSGSTPNGITNNGFKLYKYTDAARLSMRIEEAAKIAGN